MNEIKMINLPLSEIQSRLQMMKILIDIEQPKTTLLEMLSVNLEKLITDIEQERKPRFYNGS